MRIRFKILCCLTVVSASAWSQDFDRQIFSDADILGTARYVAMGGAFAALGGDVSAVVDNPAALGVFRHGEVSATGDFAYDRVLSAGVINTSTRFSIPQFSWVINFNYGADRQRGLLCSSLMLQYHRLKNYKRNSSFAAPSDVSLTDLVADLTNGLKEVQLQEPHWWESDNVGTLSKTGYELGLITVNPANEERWLSILSEGQNVNTSMKVEESGSVNEYSIAWGGNISNLFYVGLGANMHSVSYSRRTDYQETFEDKDFFLISSFTASGFGFNANLGFIVRPVSWMRMSLSYQTPTWNSLSQSSYTMGNSHIVKVTDFTHRTDTYTDNSYMLPMRMTAGMAFQISQLGLFSMQYEWSHLPKQVIDDVHRMKVGTEWIIHNNFFLRTGYAFSSALRKNDMLFTPSYNDLRSDTDFKNMKYLHYISAGVGFRKRYMLVDLAYQCRIERSKEYAFARPIYNGVDSKQERWEYVSYDMKSFTHRIVLSIGWTYKR